MAHKNGKTIRHPEDRRAELEFSGFIKNLLNTDIAMLAPNVCPKFETSGTLEWHGADKPVKLTKVGTLNSLFTLMEPKAKISEEDAMRAYEEMSQEQRTMTERTLRREAQQRKGQTPYYYIVSKDAAIVARVSCRNLEYMLVPTFETRFEKQAVHVGFIPARLLFEELKSEKD